MESCFFILATSITIYELTAKINTHFGCKSYLKHRYSQNKVFSKKIQDAKRSLKLPIGISLWLSHPTGFSALPACLANNRDRFRSSSEYSKTQC
jgi:hypothetical protein